MKKFKPRVLSPSYLDPSPFLMILIARKRSPGEGLLNPKFWGLNCESNKVKFVKIALIFRKSLI